jgi:catalase
MTIDVGDTSYSPNSLDDHFPQIKIEEAGAFATYPARVDGVMRRVRSASFDDHFSQATLFWNSMSAIERDHIVAAFSFELAKVNRVEIRQRVLDEMLANIDGDLARLVGTNIGLTPAAPQKPSGTHRKSNGKTNGTPARAAASPVLSQLNPQTGLTGNITGRKIAILAAHGTAAADVDAMKQALDDAGAEGLVVAATLGTLESENGSVAVDHTLVTMPAVVFDAVYVPGGTSAATVLAASSEARLFVAEAYAHAKAIAVSTDGTLLLERAGVSANDDDDAGIVIGEPATIGARFIEAIGRHRAWGRPAPGALPV